MLLFPAGNPHDSSAARAYRAFLQPHAPSRFVGGTFEEHFARCRERAERERERREGVGRQRAAEAAEAARRLVEEQQRGAPPATDEEEQVTRG